MPARWYYRHDGAEFGPVDLPQLARLASSGHIQLNDWVREGESSPWQPLAKSSEVLAAVSAAPAAAPPRPAAHLRAAQPLPPAPPPTLQSTAKPQTAASRLRAKPAPPPPPAPVVARVAVVPVPVTPTPSAATQRLHKKRASSAPLVMILSSIGGVVVLGGVALLASLGGADPGPGHVAAASKIASKVPADEQSLNTVRRTMATSIENWRDAQIKGGLKGLVSFEITSVRWIKSNSPGDKPRLNVALSMTNTSNAPLRYASWNSQGRNGAYLVDGDLQLVATASDEQPATTLPAGESIVESFEFLAAKQDYSELRLVLPYGAVEKTGQWGYILPGKLLQGDNPSTTAPPSLAKQTKAVDPTAAEAPAAKVAPQPIVLKAASQSVADDGEPTEDIRDLVRRSTTTPARAPQKE